LQKNFGLNIKIFNDITQVIKEEMDKYISIVILSYLHDVMFDHECSEFLQGVKLAKKYCFIYLSNGYTNLNWETMTKDVFQEYVNYFEGTETKKFKESLAQLKWEEINQIDAKYQQKFEVLYTCRGIENLSLDQIDINKIYQKTNEKSPYIIISEQNDENEEENEKNDENEKKHKISELSLLYINYTYKILNIFVSTTNDDLKDDIVNNLFKTTKEILIETNNIIKSNNNFNQNNKIVSLYYSDLIVMEGCLCAILDLYENEELQLLFNDIKQSCMDIIIHSLSVINSVIINDFNSISLNKYPKLNDNENSKYIKEFKKIKEVYEEIDLCINENDLNTIFSTSFNYLFEEIAKSVNNQGCINNEESLKLFKKEFSLFKDILSSLNKIQVDKFIDKINQILNSAENKKEDNKKDTGKKE
jgi:hypothetical protein